MEYFKDKIDSKPWMLAKDFNIIKSIDEQFRS